MAVVKRYNTNRFFFSDRIMEKMRSIFENSITVVEAPTGFGKTSSVRNVLDGAEEIVTWITIENEDNTLFYTELCNRIGIVSAKIASELKNIGCPQDEETVKKIVKIISEVEFYDNYIYVFDNFQYISDNFLMSLILKISNIIQKNVKIVILTQNIKSEELLEMVDNGLVNYIGKNTLEFTPKEIQMYFRECGIKLNEEEVDYLFKYTEGWISAIYLQLLHYSANNKFEIDAGIDKLVCMAIWDKLTIEQQDFLISLSIYDSFSLKQAIFISDKDLESEEIKKLLSSNSFLRYDSVERKYYVHAILKYFLITEFDKLDIVVKRSIYERAARWYEENENYYQALLYYYNIKKYDNIYYMNISLEDLLTNLLRKNKEMFLKIVSEVSFDAKEKNIRSSIIFAFCLFMYNEKDYFENECEKIEEIINNSRFIREVEREAFLGDLFFVKSFLYYNDINKMFELCKKSYDYRKSPSSIYTKKLNLLFKNPSVLASFHFKPGESKNEIAKIEEFMILYYKITSGDSKGLEAVMKAEILYNNGNFKDSQMLCQKALYMAETRQQIHIYICTMFLMARMAIFEGDFDNFKYICKTIRNKNNSYQDLENTITVELLEGWLYMIIEKYDNIPGWLKNEKLIEEKSSTFTLAFANVVYAKYLILNKEYMKFLGISGQMLGSTRIYNNVFYEIYLYLYIAIANNNIGNKMKAIKFVKEAIEISYRDEFYMPFVENYNMISELAVQITDNDKYSNFMSDVKNIYRRYERNYKNILNKYKDEIDYGLTNRELQIARLAAKRFTNKEIADQLYIAVATVKSNLKTIFAKLNINSRSELQKFF